MVDLLSQQIVNGLVIGSVYALMALGMMVILGVLGVVNAAQGDLYMSGAYIAFSAVTFMRIDYFSAILIGMIGAAAVGVVVERLSVRPLLDRPASILLSTLGMSMVLKNVALLVWGPEPKDLTSPLSDGLIVLGPVYLTYQKLFILVLVPVVVFAFSWFLKHTRIGLALRALSIDRDAAILMGVNTRRLYMLTFALGAGLSGAAGVLLGATYSVFPTMGELPLMKGFAVVTLAGQGNLLAIVLAAMFIGVAEGLAAGFVSTSWMDLVAFSILVAVLLVEPQGMAKWMKRHG
jgi:branched-chain amino acid transport system permease protein